MTIISKFNVFGIDAKELSHKLQLAMSSSASVVLGTGFRFMFFEIHHLRLFPVQNCNFEISGNI